MKRDKYMADFETSTEEWLEKDNGIARVWAACITTVEEHPKVLCIKNNIDDFMYELIKLGNIDVYFHNLKFDGEYILSWLFANGYTYDKTGKKPKSFNVIISDTGLWYQIQITHKVYNKRYIRTNIYDSLKKLPLRVSSLAKAFKLEEAKGVIDYDLYRPVGYELTPEEIEYITNDCVIVAKALYIQFNSGLAKMTIGSDAMAGYKAILGSPKAFKYLFPTMTLECDNDFRLAYRGGFVMCNEKYRDKVVSGISFDVNSLYPSVMYGNMGALPYGIPVPYDGKYVNDLVYPLYIQKLSCKFKVKKGMIPTIQLKNNPAFMPTEYISDSKGIIDLVLTSVDLELLFKHYDVSCVEYVGGYKFRAADNLFREYIDYWSNIKAKSTGGLRQLAKLMLNSLYGKFATNPKRLNKVPTCDDGFITYKLTDPEYTDPVYTPMGAFVTARARAYTITNSQALYPYWVYSDTDSMYLTGITEGEAAKYINIHPTNLGAWKLEHHYNYGKWLRPKTYILDSVEDGLSITCAGMPDNIKEDIKALGHDAAFKAFTYGASFKGKLTPIRVKGGVILVKTDFTIKNIH